MSQLFHAVCTQPSPLAVNAVHAMTGSLMTIMLQFAKGGGGGTVQYSVMTIAFDSRPRDLQHLSLLDHNKILRSVTCDR